MAKEKQTLILVLQEDCRFCLESTGFYQRLSSKCAEANVRVVALMPQEPAAARRYLDDAKTDISEVKQVQLMSLGIKGTPTLYLVDRHGTILKEWRGKLSSDKEQEVLDWLGRETHGYMNIISPREVAPRC